MTDERNWGAEPERAPTPADGETIVFSEYGRIMDRTDYRSHWFMLVRGKHGGFYLLVKHGAGQERFQVAWNKRIASALEMLPSDDRYFMP